MAWEPVTGSLLSQYTMDGKLFYQEDQRTGKRLYNLYLGNTLVAIREVTSQLTTKYQHTDALGSPVAVTNALGQVIQRNDYEPYGKVINQPNYGGIGYTGHVQDAATGLTYMQQRYYDPGIGRFLSVDPVMAYDQPIVAFNRYHYANNNPYKFIDPDGRFANDKNEEPPPPPPVEPKTLETITVTTPRNFPPAPNSGSRDPFRPQHNPSFFQLTTFSALRRDMSSQQAIDSGELTRTVTLPALTVAASPDAIALIATTGPMAREGSKQLPAIAKSKPVRETVYHVCIGIGLCTGVRPSMYRINQQERIQQAREAAQGEARQGVRARP